MPWRVSHVVRDVYQKNLKPPRSRDAPRYVHVASTLDTRGRIVRRIIFFPPPLVSLDKLDETSFMRRGFAFRKTVAPIRVSQRQSMNGQVEENSHPARNQINRTRRRPRCLPKLEESSILVSLHRHYALTYTSQPRSSMTLPYYYFFFSFFVPRCFIVVLLCLVLSPSRSLFRSLCTFASCFCRSLVTSYSN